MENTCSPHHPGNSGEEDEVRDAQQIAARPLEPDDAGGPGAPPGDGAPPTEPGADDASPPAPGPLKQLLALIYSANPFYLASACLFLYSLTIIFNTDNAWIDTAIPLGLIAAYAVLLAATAVLIVRAGKVWDDARSLLLLIVFLCMVLSVGLDTKILENPNHALLMLLGGWLFSIALSEGLRLGLGLRFRVPFRLAYYAILGVFFLYPYWLARLVTAPAPLAAGIAPLAAPPGGESAVWGIVGFPIAAGIAFLLLLPAVRRGPAYASASSGVPWPWPWYPWTLFGALAGGVCCRTYLMTISFFPGQGFGHYKMMDSGFGLYMLIPFFLCLMILLLEHAIVTRNPGLQRLTLLGAASFYLLASRLAAPDSDAYREFVRLLFGKDGSPMVVGIIGAALFFGYAAIRRVKLAEFMFLASLVIAALSDMEMAAVGASAKPLEVDLVRISPTVPMLGVTLVLAWLAYRTRASWWCLASVGALVLTFTIEFRDTWFTAAHGAVPLHLLYVGVVMVGALCRDRFARLLQDAAAVLLPAFFFTVLFFHQSLAAAAPGWLVAAYLAALMLIAVAGYVVLGNDLYLYAGLTSLCFCIVHFLVFGCRALYRRHLPGMGLLVWADVCFVIAFAISLLKGNLLQPLSRRVCTLVGEARGRLGHCQAR